MKNITIMIIILCFSDPYTAMVLMFSLFYTIEYKIHTKVCYSLLEPYGTFV